MKLKWKALLMAVVMVFALFAFSGCKPERSDEGEVPPTEEDQPTDDDGYTEKGNTVEISTAEGLRLWADKVGWVDDFAGITVKLTADVDLSDEEWTPVDSKYKNLNGFVFDGQGHTIYGLTSAKAASSASGAEKNDPEADDVGFFGWVTGCTMTVKNVTFSGVDVKGRFSVGTLIGCLTNGELTIENVSVENSTVTGKKWFGGILGCVEGSNGTVSMKNVCLKDSVVTEYSASDLAIRVGGFVGFTANMAYDIQGGTISGNMLTAYHSVACVFGTVEVGSINLVSVTGMTITDNKVQGHASLSYLHEVLNSNDWSYTGRDSFKEGNTISGNVVELI